MAAIFQATRSMHFLELKCINFDYYFTEFCSQGSGSSSSCGVGGDGGGGEGGSGEFIEPPGTILTHLLYNMKATLHITLHWRHNEPDGVSNHQPRDCLLNCLFRSRSKKISKLRVTGLCVGNSPGPVNSPHKGPVTRKMFPFDDVIMIHDQQHAHKIRYGRCYLIVKRYSQNMLMQVWRKETCTATASKLTKYLQVRRICHF